MAHLLQLIDYIGAAIYRPDVSERLTRFRVEKTAACELFKLAQPDNGDNDGRQARMAQ